MNIWVYLDKLFYDCAGLIMKMIRQIGINQKRFILTASVISKLMHLFSIFWMFTTLEVAFGADFTFIIYVMIPLNVILQAWLLKRINDQLTKLDQLHSSGGSLALPDDPLWNVSGRVGAMFREFAINLFGTPFLLFAPLQVALFIVTDILDGKVSYLVLHYDPGHKKTLRDLIKSGWAKVVGLFAPKPTPLPQPTG